MHCDTIFVLGMKYAGHRLEAQDNSVAMTTGGC